MPGETPSQDNAYEDSYQKEERLRAEFISVLEEIGNSIQMLKMDSSVVSESFERYNQIEKEIEEFKKGKEELEEKLKGTEGEDETDKIRDEILEIDGKIDNLREELIKIMQEESGLKGNYTETESVLRLKWRRLDEVKRQLDELEDKII